jgi:hypothetical protein
MGMHQDFRAEWAAAGYKTTMGSAAVVHPPSPEFLRVYHVTSAEYGISDISLCHLKVARFSDLNDPFELMAMRFRTDTRRAAADFKEDVDSHTGLLCFSADWKNPVLWSHYGDKHRGICLGFNIRRTRVEEVLYEDKRILDKLADGGTADLDESLQALLRRTKFSSWSYEEEQRVLLPLSEAKKAGNLHFYPFGQDFQLAEVILGPKCSIPLAAVRTLVNRLHPEVTTISSRLADGHFAVVPKESTVP